MRLSRFGFMRSLRMQALLSIVLAIVLLVAGLYLSMSNILGRGFWAIEAKDVRDNVQRVTAGIDEQAAKLDFTANDWGAWDDTYGFMQDSNDDYRTANLTDASIGRLELDAMAYVRPDGSLVFGRGAAANGEGLAELQPSMMAWIKSEAGLINPDPTTGRHGVILLPEGPLLVGSRAILTSAGTGPARGTLIFGRFLNAAVMEKVSKSTQVRFEIARLDQPLADAALRNIQSKLQTPKADSVLVEAKDIKQVQGATFLTDLAGKPVLLVRTTMQRPIHQQGQLTLWSMFIVMVIIAAVLALLIMGLLERLVLSRVSRLVKMLGAIGASSNPKARVEIEGQDELANLSKEINRMLEAIQQTQIQLVQAEKMGAVGRLASGVAHEVKNPLGIILQGISFLRKDYNGHTAEKVDQQQVEVLGLMQESVERADRIIRGLLDFSSSARLELRPARVDTLLLKALSLVERQLTINNVQVVQELAENLPLVRVNENQLTQVFINLIENAHHAMPNGGKLTLRCVTRVLGATDPSIGRRASDRFRLGDSVMVCEIADTGAGISKENLSKICDPFFTTKDPGKGTGLGLSVSRQIVESHDGSMHFSSVEGVGTTVTLFFPIDKAGPQ